MSRTAIGSRWVPGEAMRLDTRTGQFEHLNSRTYADDDSLRVQRAFLRPEPVRGNGRIRGVLLACAIGVALAAVPFIQLSSK